MLKKVSTASKLRSRLGLRSAGSLKAIGELEEEKQHSQIEQDPQPSYTNMSNSDSGNASGYVSPTVSHLLTIVNTNLSPNDVLAFVQHLPT